MGRLVADSEIVNFHLEIKGGTVDGTSPYKSAIGTIKMMVSTGEVYKGFVQSGNGQTLAEVIRGSLYDEDSTRGRKGEFEKYEMLKPVKVDIQTQ